MTYKQHDYNGGPPSPRIYIPVEIPYAKIPRKKYQANISRDVIRIASQTWCRGTHECRDRISGKIDN